MAFKTFRLIQSGLCDAATNMATDVTLFLSYRQGEALPVLRLYGWKPAAFSVGISQNPGDVLDLEACAREGIDIVRRPTGGGVILHDHELTYSLVLAQSDLGLGIRVKESFEIITSFLLLAYRMLGLAAAFAKDRGIASPPDIAPFCFSRNEEYDILVDGKKIGGNAQKRRKDVILLHGSIPFTFDKEKLRRFLKDTSALDLCAATSLNKVAGDKMDFESLSGTLVKAFSRHFKANPVPYEYAAQAPLA